jgi:hypothetical protein
MSFRTTVFVTAALLGAAPGPGGAEEAAPSAASSLGLELNDAQASQKGCRLTFLVTNGLTAGLDKAAFEIALFDAKGVVDRLAVLDFQDLPSGKSKVVRFDLAGIDCKGISRILVNDATQCTGPGVEPRACMRELLPRSRATMTFGL